MTITPRPNISYQQLYKSIIEEREQRLERDLQWWGGSIPWLMAMNGLAFALGVALTYYVL